MEPILPSQRELFDLPREVAWLNAAQMTPLPRAALEAGEAGLRRKAQPWSITPADFFPQVERGRALLAGLINASPEDVAVVPSASYGLATAARNLRLKPGQRVLTVADGFPSNVYAWRRLAAERGGEVVTVEAGDDGDLTAAVLQALDERVAIAALPACRWTDGRRLDLARIGARCRDLGAGLALDLTQSLGAIPFDVAEVRPDFMVAAGYKWLMGPYSLGWLYVAPRHHDGVPLEENWIARAGSEDFTRLIDYQDAYQPGARRFDMGERSNFALIPAALASLELITGWGVPVIAATLLAKTREIADRLAPFGFEAVPEHLRAPHYLGLKLPPDAPKDITARLAERRVYVSQRGDRLRVTPHVYTDEGDMERLAATITDALRRG